MPKSLAPPHPKQTFTGFGTSLIVSVDSLKKSAFSAGQLINAGLKPGAYILSD
jgi:hypothetical protein